MNYGGFSVELFIAHVDFKINLAKQLLYLPSVNFLLVFLAQNFFNPRHEFLNVCVDSRQVFATEIDFFISD